MQKGFFQLERYNTTVYHLIFLDFWCIMHLYRKKRHASLAGKLMYQGYTLHQKLHQHTHVRILDNSRYDLVCVVLFLENSRKFLIILDNSRFLPESPQ